MKINWFECYDELTPEEYSDEAYCNNIETTIEIQYLVK